jgi:hypothetical protein
MIDRNTMIIPSMPKHHAEYASKADDPNPLRPADVARLEKIKGRFFIKDPLSGRKDVEVLYVTSSNLNMLAYSHSRKVLRVEFKGSGKLRRPRTYQAVMTIAVLAIITLLLVAYVCEWEQ